MITLKYNYIFHFHFPTLGLGMDLKVYANRKIGLSSLISASWVTLSYLVC